MKGKELADCLMKHPEWDVQFLFMQGPDEVCECCDRFFDITDVGNGAGSETIILLSDENEERID